MSHLKPLLFAIVVSAGLSGCLPNGGVRSLLSLSSNQDSLSEAKPSVDLSGITPGQAQKLVFQADNGSCSCSALATGTANAGNLALSACAPSGVSAATCTALEGTFAYTNASGTVKICQAAAGCETY